MYSYRGRYLVIDLTTRTAEVAELGHSLLKDYLGGVGLGTRLLYERCPEGTDPLDPGNPLIFASSSLTGTMSPASAAHAVVTKSPLTGLLGDSLSFGNWSLSLKSAGYDALVITGRSDTPVYLWIDDDYVHFRQADGLWGKGASETSKSIRSQAGDGRVQVAAIGPGGENLVRYACISNDGYRQAGRTGCGAVMGSKRLKAIAIRGTQPVSVFDGDEMRRTCAGLYSRSQAARKQNFRGLGTPYNVMLLNRIAALPTWNFQEGAFPGAEDVSGEKLADTCLARVVACPTCPLGCEHLYSASDRDRDNSNIETALDYGSLSALGPMCGINDISTILKAALLCHSHGIDTISTGNAIAWAMESFQKGILDRNDTDGVDLAFGNGEALLQMIDLIGRRAGLGSLLAEGVMRAATVTGRGSDQWAMHTKGLELPGYDPRTMKTQALALAVGLRGGYYNRSSSYELDMVHILDSMESQTGWGKLNMEQEDLAAIFDSLITCKAMRDSFTNFLPEAAGLYTVATGIEMSAGDLRLAGERINNLKKVFNIKHGWKKVDDWLPPRLLQDPVTFRESQSVVLSPEVLRALIEDYYTARGWTSEGLVPVTKMRELGMADILEEGNS